MAYIIYIKNMVCFRCKKVVESIFTANGIPFIEVQLGFVKTPIELTAIQKTSLEKNLQFYELELIEDRKKILVEKIKSEIENLLRNPHHLSLKLSVYLSNNLDYNYTYLTNTFTEVEHITLERYFITRRIERVKELIVYDEQTINDIVEILNFSSASHLGNQFKKVTGITPAEFRKNCRIPDYIWREI